MKSGTNIGIGHAGESVGTVSENHEELDAPSGNPPSRKHTTASLAGGLILIALAGWLRFAGLEITSITHPEMYVPGIHLPAGLSEPAERLTFTKVVTSTVASDTHPPVFYVLMLLWTKLFGVKLWVMRLPAAFWGLLCIPLIYWLGKLALDSATGAIAAILLALNGFHIFYSQHARMYILSCLLGLVSTTLLLLAAKDNKSSRATHWLYAIVTLTGLATHHFFWAVFVTQTLWASLQRRRGDGLPALGRIQLLILILASPLIAVAAYQSGAPAAATGVNLSIFPVFVVRFLQFGFLYPPNEIASSAISVGLAVFSLIVLVIGFLRPWRSAEQVALPGATSPSRKFWVAAAAVAVIGIGLMIAAILAFAERRSPTLPLAEALVVLPLVLLAAAIMVERGFSAGARPRIYGWATGEKALIGLLVVMPLALLGIVGIHKPIYNERGALVFVPYLLLGMAAGISTLARRRRIAIGAGILLIGLHAVSVRAYWSYRTDAVDYRALAGLISAEIKPDDLIFLRKSWNVTPILFYLPDSRYHLIANEYRRALRRNAESRVWALALYEEDIAEPMKAALQQYEVAKVVRIPRAKAILYQHH